MNEAHDAGSTADSVALKARIRDLEATLNQKNLDIAVAFHLTPALANLLGLLLSMPLVTADTIQNRLEIVTDAKVAIHRLRKRMTRCYGRLGLAEGTILIQGRRHVGYWIEPTHKELLRSVVSNDVTQEVTEAAA